MSSFFNENGLPTNMSCQGHNKTNMSMFWIEFDRMVTEDNIIRFMRSHLNWMGNFCSCGRFAKRVVAYTSVAATVEAADADLYQWTHDTEEWQGVNGERYQAWRWELVKQGKL